MGGGSPIPQMGQLLQDPSWSLVNKHVCLQVLNLQSKTCVYGGGAGCLWITTGQAETLDAPSRQSGGPAKHTIANVCPAPAFMGSHTDNWESDVLKASQQARKGGPFPFGTPVAFKALVCSCSRMWGQTGLGGGEKEAGKHTFVSPLSRGVL